MTLGGLAGERRTAESAALRGFPGRGLRAHGPAGTERLRWTVNLALGPSGVIAEAPRHLDLKFAPPPCSGSSQPCRVSMAVLATLIDRAAALLRRLTR
jgi:hypothetical protein